MCQARVGAQEVGPFLCLLLTSHLRSPDPGWASISRGVLVCDECCSVHRSLGRHISIVKHLRHSAWPPTLLQVGTEPETVVHSVQCQVSPRPYPQPCSSTHAHTHLFITSSSQGQPPLKQSMTLSPSTSPFPYSVYSLAWTQMLVLSKLLKHSEP